MATLSTLETYTGSTGKPNPNCAKCGGTGMHPKGMFEPEKDFMVSCDCEWSGWQYQRDVEIEH